MVASNEVLPGPCLSAETLKACALVGLHLLAAEGEDGSGGSQSPDLGDMWRCGGQNKNPSGFVSKTRLWLWQKRWNAWNIRFSAGFGS